MIDINTSCNVSKPLQGVGVGLRDPHLNHVLEVMPDIPWFEILIDNYLNKGGKVFQNLSRIAQAYPLSFHGVGMSLGSTDPLNQEYLSALKKLCDEFNPVHVSDHLCWTCANGLHSHELLPLSYTSETINQVVNRIQQVQDFLGRRILVENVSSYLSYKESVMTEWQFYCEIVQRADCYMLLDVNNIYISAYNHGFDALDYINAIPENKVKEIHLAGFENRGDYLLDTHGAKVDPAVWQLYEYTIKKLGQVPTLIEWDNDIPDFSVLIEEACKANKILMESSLDVA